MKKVPIILFLLCFCFYGIANELKPIEKQIVEHATPLIPESLRLLEKIVNINSGTDNPEGVKKVAFALKGEFEKLNMKTRYVNIEHPKRGGHLFIETKNPNPNALKILIISHIDTVFGKKSPFQKWTKKGNKARGPGVNDAKGGIVVILSALKALKKAGVLKGMNIKIALMGDEEMPAFNAEGPLRSHLIKMAKNSDVALGFEYAVDTINKATIARRGYISWTIEVSAEGGHSSKIFSSSVGAGANFSAIHILNNIRNTLSKHKYLTINPGLIIGGTEVDLKRHGITGKASGKHNVIATKALITGDLRFISLKQLHFAKAKLKQIVSKPLKGTKAFLHFNQQDYNPPVPPTSHNKVLLKLLSQVNQDLGYGQVTALDPGLRGTADVAFVAHHVKALLDGLGALGEGAHSEKESLDITTLPQLINRTALLLYRLKDFDSKKL